MAEESRMTTVSIHLGPLFFALSEDHADWIRRVVFFPFFLYLIITLKTM